MLGGMVEHTCNSWKCKSRTWQDDRLGRTETGPTDAVSHPPAQRRKNRSRSTHANWLILLTLTCIILFAESTLASAIPTTLHLREQDALLIDDLIIDTRPPPLPRVRIEERQEVETSTTGTIEARDTTTTSEKAASTSTQSSLASASLPQPFDNSLGNNFTQSSCPAFFESFLSNTVFESCLPLSLLLQTSNGFFSAQRSPVLLSQTLDATCNVNITQCNNLMASLAVEIRSDANCGDDYNAQNPMVLQAYDGFIAYQPLYHAGCLKDVETGSYCFTDAATNASSPTSSYIYYLPLGIALPSTTKPTCSTCLQDTMAIFASAATNSSQPVSTDYGSAASLIDGVCGDAFVNASVTATSAAYLRRTPLSVFDILMLPVLAGVVLVMV